MGTLTHLPAEGSYERWLCVCTVGRLRSPTVAWVLSQEPYCFNTRAVGTDEDALIRVNQTLVDWADVIVCMTRHEVEYLKKNLDTRDKPIHVLNIRDKFEFRQQWLISLIHDRMASYGEVLDGTRTLEGSRIRD